MVNEVGRQLSAASAPINAFHYRDKSREIDLILQRRDGAVVAIEIKATSSPTSSQLRHVQWLKEKLDQVSPGSFLAGVLLHTRSQSLTVGDRLHLTPISALWNAA